MKSIYSVFAILATVCTLVLGIYACVAGGCSGMLTCGESQVPMKCFWTFRVIAACGFGAAVLCLCGVIAKTKEGRLGFMVGAIVLLILVYIVAFGLIGVCAKAGMACIAHRTVASIIAAVGLVCALVAIAKANPDKVAMPKQKL